MSAAEDGGAPAPAAAAPLFSAANQKAVRALTLCAVARNLGIMIRMQTETEIWLRAYAGDFAAQAGAREQQIGGSGGSLEPPGPLLEPPAPLRTHPHAVYTASSERLPTRLSPPG